MAHHPEKHTRRSIRLKGYDYKQSGAYFVTICTQNRVCLFGTIQDERMHLNTAGRVVSGSWAWLANQYDYVELDEYVVMPNHIHGILIIMDGDCRGGSRTAPTRGARKPLGRLLGAFKTVSTKRINQIRKTLGTTLWQRNYFEHIIRNETSLERIREYIANNPAQWEMDRENLSRKSHGAAPPF